MGGGLLHYLSYHDSLFSAKQMAMIAEFYNRILLSIIDDLDYKETHQALLGEKRKQILIDWNDKCYLIQKIKLSVI